ncbi:competence protein CoiA family protein [Leptolyngbya sp. GGD]|uniref:competence protein CoiA family protein n=1 Tax=Leptolyngbya sp. GGD TaxID=2997907 RepID=UPI00227C29AE|nr:competence protein CoiA family protein [Leptolyngbya sp. GGD]MCY6494312.1 competence protein CoiA family protein [Leptolyngbya sp. GGD]
MKLESELSLLVIDPHELRSKYPLGSLRCPLCKQGVFPREREGFARHFVDQRVCSSNVPRHPESPEHEEGKMRLAKYLQEQIKDDPEKAVEIEVEYYFKFYFYPVLML